MGLSKTSTSIGWVLVDGSDVDGDPLDHDAFDITDASAAAPAATARRVRDIATASGYTVDSVHVTTSGNVSSLRDALSECGFDDVVLISPTEATRAWAMGAARTDDQGKTAICVLGRDSASLSLIETGSGAIQATTTTESRDSAALAAWLNDAFGHNGSRPESLYLIGSRAKLGDVADSLADSLSIPVIATHDAQLALARGAAASTVPHLDQFSIRRRPGFASYAKTFTAVGAVAVVSLFTLSSAGSPVSLAQRSLQQPADPPPAARSAQPPATALPVAPVVLPPSAEAPPPPPEQVPAAPIPEFVAAPEPPAAAAPVAPSSPVVAEPSVGAPVAAPETTPAAVPAAAAGTEHLPDVAPVEHIPDAQPAVAPGPIAPGPVAPAPLPPQQPPPPPDPLAEVLSPLFGGLP
ncbi:hypothetical protein DVS77_21110 [Mycolicibacterium moriokaense]|nr:hypothetical protein DVS77_21110 [Mycolicibacterium moriokaense]